MIFNDQQAFYENVVRGFIARGKGEAKEPLYTQVAVVTPSNSESGVIEGGVGTNGAGGEGVPPQLHPGGGGNITGGDVDAREESLRNTGGTGGHGSVGVSAAGAGEERGVRDPGREGPSASLEVDGVGVDSVESAGARWRKEEIAGLITCQVGVCVTKVDPLA